MTIDTVELPKPTFVIRPDRPYGEITNLGVPGLELKRSIRFKVDHQDGVHVVDERQTRQYGYGETIGEAVADYVVTITEYFQDLRTSNPSTLGATPLRHLAWLNRRIDFPPSTVA